MSLEDEYHKNLHYNERTLIIRINVNNINNIYIEKLKQNISSEKIDEILNKINTDKFTQFTSKDIILNKHPLFYLDIKDNIFDLHVNHCYIGGSILVRLIENILDIKPRYIPKTNLLQGLLYSLYDFKHIFNFFRIKNTEKIENREKLLYYSKLFTVYKTKECSRLGWTYYTILHDILKVLNRDKITIGIPVPFENNVSNIYNNIGIIVFEYTKLTTPVMTENILKNNVNLAYATNAIQLYGKQLSKIINKDNYSSRKKIDVICSCFTCNNNSIPGNFCLLPKINIIETLYVSISICLAGDKKRGDVYANITTKDSNFDFKKLKYVNNML